MLNSLLAHAGAPPEPHDLWGAWNLDPLLVTGIVLTLWVYRRGYDAGGRSRSAVWRARSFVAAMVAIALAVLSPVDALSGALASAHMVQHVLLVLVAAPLLALSAPSSALLRGSPLALRRVSGGVRRRLGLGSATWRMLREPAAVWLLHVATLWLWHASVLYDAALDSTPLHAVEHATFLVTGVLFWRVVVGARGLGRLSPGPAVLLVFGMGLQSVLLSALLTFAQRPWYAGYEETTIAWGLQPLADQQLAGVIMWVPGGFVYLAAALGLMATWLRAMEREDLASSG